VKLKKEN
jgi:hypothetical protein